MSDEQQITLPVSPRDHIQGLLSAEITLVQYGDYACLHSQQAYSGVKNNMERFGPHLRFAFRHFPITQIHPDAQRAAEAAESAGVQGKFWEMHDSLFAHQEALESGYLVEYADALHLDTTQFLRDMAQHTFAKHVAEDYSSGMQSGVNNTPTFFINGVLHDDLWDIEVLLQAVSKAADAQKQLTLQGP